MRKCAQPGCNAKVMTNALCEHHRERKRAREVLTPEQAKEKNRRQTALRRRRRIQAGLMPGWGEQYG